MLTVLAVLGVLAVLFLAAAVATSDREVLVEAPPDGADLDLPSRPMEPADVGRLRFGLALRGYRMSEVDAALARLAAELADRDRALAEALAPSAADRDTAAAHAVSDLASEAPVDDVPAVDEVPFGAAPVAQAPAGMPPDTDTDADSRGTEPSDDAEPFDAESLDAEPLAGRAPDQVRR